MLIGASIRNQVQMGFVDLLNLNTFIGREFGTSTVLKPLGRGSMAAVFVAYQQTLKRKIALKIMPKEGLGPTALKRFRQEAEAAAILAHPNIIPIYEIGETEEFLFMSMQLVDGKDLAQYLGHAQKHLLPSKRVLPVGTTIKIVVQVLGALEYAHSRQVIHRDVKPANILIEKESKRPLISDFGTARFVRGKDREGHVIIGTPLFMAPEQITTPEVDGRADIYAVGVMLFQMLTPALPLKPYASAIELLEHKRISRMGIFLKKASQVNETLNEAMDRILAKSLAYDPDKRFASCRAFANALKAYFQMYIKQGQRGAHG